MKSQKKARKSLDKLKAKLEVQKSRLSGAVEGFKAHSKRLVPAVIDPTEAGDIFRNLHLMMKQTELSAEAEIGVIEDEMAPVEHLIRQEQMVALQVERDLRKQTTICVSSRDEVRVLKNSGIGYGLSVVRSAKDRSSLISFYRSAVYAFLIAMPYDNHVALPCAAIPKEAKGFEVGETTYYLVLVCSAIVWQCFFLGAIGVVVQCHSLAVFLSGCNRSRVLCLLSAVILPVTEVVAVIFYQGILGMFQPENGVSPLFAFWGFVSYFYGELKHRKEKNKTQNRCSETGLPESITIYHSVMKFLYQSRSEYVIQRNVELIFAN
ncbi:hypothetical protein RHGRI_022017 [Rhododendron griersonianum]|uniref:Probable purine permease n=1 Tax=Rhododendron griersonianum TaxID=479676 RepID=A0AAV6JM89_9ERIC|nr:hypothetical protein RHGRI_022017 [Rhododendron griersonianum]